VLLLLPKHEPAWTAELLLLLLLLLLLGQHLLLLLLMPLQSCLGCPFSGTAAPPGLC
jgi:hypothetical protein